MLTFPVFEFWCRRIVSDVPVNLLSHFIKLLSNENDVVLDPFMGAGSTGVACMGLKRNFVGIDINEEYVNTSIKRIEDEA